MRHIRESTGSEFGPGRIVKVLEECYAADHIPCSNPVLAEQRTFADGDSLFWAQYCFASPIIGARGQVLFDHRRVDPRSLADHPLLNPAYLSDNWNKMQKGALPVPSAYVDALADLARAETQDPLTGRRLAWSVPLNTIKEQGINDVGSVSNAGNTQFATAFLGLMGKERPSYLSRHKEVRGDRIVLWYHLDDASQEDALGRVSVFNYSNDLIGDGNLGNKNARLFGVPFGAEGATQNFSGLETQIVGESPSVDAILAEVCRGIQDWDPRTTPLTGDHFRPYLASLFKQKQ